MIYFVNFLKIVHVILCILVIFGVLMSHQKSEGLAGVMGQSSYSTRGMKGMDEGMRRMITWLGGGLIVSAIILGVMGY
jgi:protein translocase SecG subunit